MRRQEWWANVSILSRNSRRLNGGLVCGSPCGWQSRLPASSSAMSGPRRRNSFSTSRTTLTAASIHAQPQRWQTPPIRGGYDQGWVTFVVKDGHCAPITPRSAWRLISRSGELSYMTYAGTTAPPGSFYIKTDELVEIEATTIPAPVEHLPALQPQPDAAISPPVPSVLPPEEEVSPLAGAPSPTAPGSEPGPVTRSHTTGGYIHPPEERRRPAPRTAEVQSPIPPPAALPQSPEAAPTLPATTPGSGSNGLIVVIALVGAFLLLRRLFRKPIGRKTRREPKVGPAATRTRAARASEPAGPAAAKSGTLAVWHAKSSVVTVAGHTIGGGMVYVGAQHPSAPGGSPCFIDPALDVARSDPDTAGSGMPYWPSYARIPPRCRLAYLGWLASGRSDPAVGIGYVFLFFYGLERRLFVTGTDRQRHRTSWRRWHAYAGFTAAMGRLGATAGACWRRSRPGASSTTEARSRRSRPI